MSHSVKGWCPGAYRPMMSGDGLIIRVRPRLGRLTCAQALGLCDLSQRYGNGLIDLTSRANLQLRGVALQEHDAVLDQLLTLGMLDETPDLEARRNILTTPDWIAGDITTRLHDALVARLGELPNLPAKMGFALDTGAAPLLTGASGDFRLERGAKDGDLVLRADGMGQGRAVTESTAIDAIIEMAHWYHQCAKADTKRMAQLVRQTELPPNWCDTDPRRAAACLVPGVLGTDRVYGVAFGSIRSTSLQALLRDSRATALRTTPWRLLVLEDAQDCAEHGFISESKDALLSAHACAGSPACGSASVETRALARALAPYYPKGLHVSGCAKGCALPKDCATTIVGRNGAYDLIEQGAPWDSPRQQGLLAQDLMNIKA
ncbi:MAG: cobalamin biosynthesis protein CobG [Aliishimia sp.]